MLWIFVQHMNARVFMTCFGVGDSIVYIILLFYPGMFFKYIYADVSLQNVTFITCNMFVCNITEEEIELYNYLCKST